MPVTFFVEPSRLPSWSPWSEWLESGARREPRCLWLRRPALKRGAELPLQLHGPGGKRVCCRPAAESDGYRQVVDVAGYRPDGVRVRLSADGQVTVSACHRERSDTGFSHSRMVRRLSLPQHVRTDQLSSRWTPAGQLVLEAPVAEPSERCCRCPRGQRKVIVVPVVTYDTPAVKEGEEKTGEAEEGEKTEESQTGKTSTHQEEAQEERAQEEEAEQSDGQDMAVDVEAAAGETPETSSGDVEDPTKKTQDGASETAEAALQRSRSLGEVSEKTQDGASETAEAAPAEDAPDAAGEPTAAAAAAAHEPAEVVDLEAEAAARQEEETVPVTVRSGSPVSECDQSSVLASVDVSSFLPEEVEVRVSGRHLVIEAVHEETAGDGGSCQLRLARRLPLPTHVDPDLVTCRLTRAGQLLLEAPVTPAPGA